ncbi:MAG TPA: lipid A biosynthesis acyltransferase [Myxococcaceae bacterium]|nr:lipid A biosynthesis acyltransferase [Myxococcaceae bacterium]
MAPPLSKRLKRTLRYGLLRTALALVGLLPLGWAQALGRALGSAAFHLAPGERKKALASLSIAFPEMTDAARLDLARRCFRHLGTAALEVAVAPRLSQGQFDRLVDCSGDALAAMDRAHTAGKGAVCVAAHLGNWELQAWGVARHGLPLHAVGKENVDPRLTRLVDRFRAAGGVRNIWRGQPGAAVSLLRTLRKGELLAMLIDQDTNVQNVFVPFFGRLAATPRAAADLVLRTGAAALVCLVHKREDGTYRPSSEELEVPRTGDPERDAVELTARFTARIEAAIRAHPEQWVWMHQRWKTKAC